MRTKTLTTTATATFSATVVGADYLGEIEPPVKPIIEESLPLKDGMVVRVLDCPKHKHLVGHIVRISTTQWYREYANSPNFECYGTFTEMVTGDPTYFSFKAREEGTILKKSLNYELIDQSEVTALIEAQRLAYWTTYKPQSTDERIRATFGYDGEPPVASIGADPEIFVVDRDSGELLPAFGFLPSKDQAVRIERQYKSKAGKADAKVFWDGFQAEMTPGASHCLCYTGDNLKWCLDELAIAYRKVNGKLTTKTVFEVDREVLANADPEHVALGCMPSLNAYGMKAPFSASCGQEATIRSAGCHFHLGFASDVNNREDREDLYRDTVKTIDRIAGVAMTALLDGMEDIRRRMWYGMAGEYRIKGYGLEYRTLSSAVMGSCWLFHLAGDLVRQAARLHVSGNHLLWDCTEEEAIQVINRLDVELARAILKRNLPMFANILKSIYFMQHDRLKVLVEYFFRGVVNVDPSVLDVDANWQLTDDSDLWSSHCESDKAQVGRYIGMMTRMVKFDGKLMLEGLA
jgi:hypothetical protein